MTFRLASNRNRRPLRGVSRLMLAAALAGGVAFGAPAVAQDYSRPFIAAYQPVVVLVNGETPNPQAARDQLASVEAAIQNADDRNAAGSLTLQIGNQLSDPVLQRRGLELMLASGKVAPAQVGQFQFFVGNLAFSQGDFAAARTALNEAVAAGYTQDDPRGLILESYFEEDRTAEGVAYLAQQAGLGTVPENWILRSLQAAYNEELVSEATQLSGLLVRAYPTERNWMNALQVINALYQFEPGVQLDLLRLMRHTNSLSQRNEYVLMIEQADPRVMSNEVLPILAEGLAAGHFDAADNYYVEVKALAESRAAADRRDADAAIADARAGDARLTLNTGDLLWSLSDYVRAEELYRLALEKGADRDTALTRIGMAQVKQGKFAEAVTTFGQVGGARAPVAAMWAAYAQSQG